MELYHQEGHMAQYSSTNSWNANNNAIVNNNNRRNENRVCAVSDLERRQLFVSNMFAAYYECRRNKRGSISEANYEIDGVRRTLQLADDVWNFRYVISPSICFIIHVPTIREVFAADFRDRICDTWAAMRLERIFAKRLPKCICANRKKMGTSYAINKICVDMRTVTGNYTEDAWIYKFDLQGFFMSVDKRILWSELKPVLEEDYQEWDKDWFLYVVEKRIFNRPQENCIKVCPDEDWLPLDKNKSLFGQDRWHGLPIGDLLSQMLVGFFLVPFINYLQSIGLQYATNYVDDFVVISPSKDLILESIPKIRKYLMTRGLTLHPHKCYIQHYTEGVQFLGAIIKPYRVYAGHRLRRNAHHLYLSRNVRKGLASVNSYLGLLKPYCTRKTRIVIASKCFNRYKGKVQFGKDYLKMIIIKHPVTRCRKATPRPKAAKPHGLQAYYASDM